MLLAHIIYYFNANVIICSVAEIFKIYFVGDDIIEQRCIVVGSK